MVEVDTGTSFSNKSQSKVKGNKSKAIPDYLGHFIETYSVIWQKYYTQGFQNRFMSFTCLYCICYAAFKNVPISFENYQRIVFQILLQSRPVAPPTRITCTSNLSLQNNSRQSQAGNTRDYLADSVKQLEQTLGTCVMSSAHRPSSHTQLTQYIVQQAITLRH